MSRTRVYLLLATYQGEAYLPTLLQSVRDQSHADWTLLVRDDGSRDATRQILRDAAQQDGRIVIADDDGQRRGAVGNFAWLLEKARHDGGDYFLFADQDDIWHPDKVARQIEALQAGESGDGQAVPQLVYCDAAVVDAAGRPVHASFLRHNRLPYGSARPLPTLLGRSFVLGCMCAANRSLVDLALPLPEAAVSHDWWLALCAASSGRITCLDVPLLDYRRHAANASQAVFWTALASPGQWRRRWQIGWRDFVRSLDQAKALRGRLRERRVLAGKDGELLEAFCRIVEQPGRWRKLRELHRLGVPAIGWTRRIVSYLCLLLLR